MSLGPLKLHEIIKTGSIKRFRAFQLNQSSKKCTSRAEPSTVEAKAAENKSSIVSRGPVPAQKSSTEARPGLEGAEEEEERVMPRAAATTRNLN